MPEPEYECDQCGACCGLIVDQVYEIDVLREPRILNNAMPMKCLDGDTRYWLDRKNNRCVFQGDDNRCQIYPTRPNTCVGFEAGAEQCQERREAAGLPPLEPIPTPKRIARRKK